jgi:hypothetical protein
LAGEQLRQIQAHSKQASSAESQDVAAGDSIAKFWITRHGVIPGSVRFVL